MRKSKAGTYSFRKAPLLLAGFVALAHPLRSQGPGVNIVPRISIHSRTEPSANIKVETVMVVIPVTVTSPSGHPVTDLPKGSFRVFENNVEQVVLSVSRESGPASVGFIVDTSRSMERRISYSLLAIEQVLKEQVDGDEWFVLRFSDSPTMLTGFTENPEDVRAAVSSIQCEGWTALNDAVYLGTHVMKRARNARKALIVLTDGEDNHSRYSDGEIRTLVRESDVSIYSIGLFERVKLLGTLGKESGGNALWVSKTRDLPDAVARLSSIFRNQYMLGYTPTDRSKDGKYRNVSVRLVETIGSPPLRVSWRRGYYSPN